MGINFTSKAYSIFTPLLDARAYFCRKFSTKSSISLKQVYVLSSDVCSGCDLSRIILIHSYSFDKYSGFFKIEIKSFSDFGLDVTMSLSDRGYPTNCPNDKSHQWRFMSSLYSDQFISSRVMHL